jgi:threonine/homoserine/homoserine lactone efflux protein
MKPYRTKEKKKKYCEDNKEKVMRKRDLVSTFLAGYFMNTLNPSVFLFWFAWTAAISASAAETNSPLVYRILVFGTCLLFVLLSDLIKVALAGKLRPKLTLQNMIIINRISGLIILIFSAALFYGALQY